MAKKSITPLDDFKNQLRGSPNPIRKLAEIRQKLGKADLIRLLQWLPQYHRDGRGLFQWQFPRRIADLRRQGVLSAISADKEIVWAARRLLQNADRINAFRVHAEQFERELTSKNYQNCRSQLDELEKRLGTSIWLIENKISILQLVEGIESQKAYAVSIREARGGNDLVSYLAFCISYRNENAVTVPHYVSQIIAAVDPERGVNPEIGSYVLYRCTNRIPKSEDEIGTLLRYEENSSIIDLYETFLLLAKWSIANPAFDLKDIFVREVKTLALAIKDFRLENLLFLGGVLKDISGTPAIPLDLHDSFIAGEYGRAVQAALSANEICTSNSSAWFVEAKARAEDSIPPRPEDSQFSTVIINLVRSVVMREEDENALAKLAKYRLNFRLLNFSSSLEPFLAEASSSDPISLGTPDQVACFVDNPIRVPEAYQKLPTPELREGYGKSLEKAYGHPPSLYFEIMRSGDPCPLPFPKEIPTLLNKDLLLIMHTERELRLGNYVQALELSTELTKVERRTAYWKLAQFHAHALLRCGRIPQLTEFIVVSVLKDKSMVRNLPIRECAEALDKSTRRLLRANLSTSVLLDLYSRNVNDSLDSERSFAYEDFLISNGFERPSQLAEKVTEFPVDQLQYYLRYLCTPSVMERSGAFAGTTEVEDERLKVLALLVKVDPDNSATYSGEIGTITRNKKIRQGVMHVEQSKISIDVPALRRWAHLNIKETFNRYKTFLSSGLHDESSSATDVLGEGAGDKNFTREKDVPDVPTNEIIDVIGKMIHSLFYEFTTNPEHGLDCYLSIRIRHGPIYGQLLSPLEKEEIISQRRSDSDEYNTHPSWTNRLKHLDYSIRTGLISRLKQFSKEYADFINRIANELIQIKTKDKKNGLFVITDETGGRAQIRGVGIPKFATFLNAIKADTTFDTFLDSSFGLFWESVEHSLKNIRGLIDSSLKLELARLFTTLETDIAAIAGDGTIADLNTSIRVAKTNAQEALDRVKEWFRLPKPLTAPELAFQDLVDIGLQMVRATHPEFDPVVNMDIPPLPLIEGVVERLFDIFQIIFENIRKHSGLGKNPQVTIKLERKGDRLSITIENEVAMWVRTPELEARLETIKQSIAKGRYQSGVRLEGGSGLFKLRARVGSAQGQPLPLDFGFSPEGWFFVQFEVAIRHIGEGEA